MKKYRHIIIIVYLIPQLCAALSPIDEVSEQLRNRIESSGIPVRISVENEIIFASRELPKFYEQRTFLPAWSDDNGPLIMTYDLMDALAAANSEGLNPNDYHLENIRTILEILTATKNADREFNNGRIVDLDLLCTDAFLIYGAHLLAGRVNPETIDPQWKATLREIDLAAMLQQALATKEIIKTLTSLLPPQRGYVLLKTAYHKYQSIMENGGWPTIEQGAPLKIGDTDQRIAIVKKRLFVTDDLRAENPQSENLFDERLKKTIQIFQTRHGIESNGIIDDATLHELNIPVTKRLAQIRVNLERWRWLPQELGKRHVLVNIANFELDVIEDDKKILVMRVIVGKQYRKTPVFSDKITYMVLNPYWHVPDNIARQDILPLIKKNPGYLSQNKIRVFQSWGATTEEINPSEIDWSTITTNNLTYRFRQDPGPENALGRIKFMFPNQFNVYLHDTPARDLFQKPKRDFSSGCIRVEKPIELAMYLLSTDRGWTREKIEMGLSNPVEQTLRLPQPMPVHILYWTSWADEAGTIQFRKDIYGRDTKLLTALKEEPYDN